MLAAASISSRRHSTQAEPRADRTPRRGARRSGRGSARPGAPAVGGGLGRDRLRRRARPGRHHGSGGAGAGQGRLPGQTHALIALAHAAAMPARYVTGYLLTGEDEDGEAAHAWGEAPRRRPRLDRVRPRQPLLPGRALHPPRLGPRRPRGRADPRGVARRRRRGDGRDGRGRGPAAIGRPGAHIMTYCVGLLLDAGVVMLSDTRTNAGIRQYRLLPQDVRLRGRRRAGHHHPDRRQPLRDPDGDREAAPRDRAGEDSGDLDHAGRDACSRSPRSSGGR